MSTNKLPSHFQIGDLVSINLIAFKVDRAIIKKVHFSESKVMYDLEVTYEFFSTPDNPAGWSTTRIYNVDSAVVITFEITLADDDIKEPMGLNNNNAIIKQHEN